MCQNKHFSKGFRYWIANFFVQSCWESKHNYKFSYSIFFRHKMNKLSIFKVLKIDKPQIELRLWEIEVLNFRQGSIRVYFSNKVEI